MKTKITITLDQAKSWFNSGNEQLRKLALQAFGDALENNFKDITTFKKACESLCLLQGAMDCDVDFLAVASKASAAMFKLNIIRKALNLNQDLHFTKDPERSYIYYPLNPITTQSTAYYEGELNSGEMEIIGKIKCEGEEYNVLGGTVGFTGGAGLGSFSPDDGRCGTNSNFGFLGCANSEIAKHFGKYFGMLITEAKYADIIKDFEIIESKYSI